MARRAHTELLVDKRELRAGWLPSLTVHRHSPKSPELSDIRIC